MGLEKGLPRGLAPAVGRGLDAVGPEDSGDRRIRDVVSQIRQCTLEAVIAPSRILTGHTQDEFNDFSCNPGTSSAFPPAAVVPVPGDEFAMPTENRIRSNDGGQLLKHLAPKHLAFDGQAPTLVIVKEDPLLPEFRSEDLVFSQ